MATTIPRTSHAELPLAAGGIAYAALLVLGAAAFPTPSDGRAPGRDAGFLASHETSVALQGYIRAAAALAFLALVLAIVRRIASPTATRVALVGGAGYAGFALAAQAAVIGAVIASEDHAGPGAVRALGCLSDGLLALSSLPAVGLFAAGAAAFRADRGLPGWLAWLTLAGVPLSLLDAASFTGSPLESVGVLGLAFFLVFGLAAGVALLRAGTRAP